MASASMPLLQRPWCVPGQPGEAALLCPFPPCLSSLPLGHSATRTLSNSRLVRPRVRCLRVPQKPAAVLRWMHVASGALRDSVPLFKLSIGITSHTRIWPRFSPHLLWGNPTFPTISPAGLNTLGPWE